MVHKGTGEEITFLETSRETSGKHELIEVFLPPGGEGPPLHYYGKFEETFEAVDGELQINFKDKIKILVPGDNQLTVPKETYHQFLNASKENPVTFRVKLVPAYHFETSMRIIYGLIADGMVNPDGIFKNPLHMAVALDMQDTHLAGVEGLEDLARTAYEQKVDQELIEKYGI